MVQLSLFQACYIMEDVEDTSHLGLVDGHQLLIVPLLLLGLLHCLGSTKFLICSFLVRLRRGTYCTT